MRDLTLVGLSEDRVHVILRSATGERFRIPSDDRLRATLRNDRARLGQLEIEMDSALRPRDIQARIRRGESPDAVAEAAQVPVDRIMGYAVPVLAEREHIADRARTATIRRRHAQNDAVTLGDAVDMGLRGSGSDPQSADWDSWRREDGRWTVVVKDGERAATFVFDSPGRFVLPDDDDARALVGDVAPAPDSTDMAIAAAVASGPRADPSGPGVASLKQARERRALAQEQLSLGMPADERTEPDRSEHEGEDAESTLDLSETAEHVRAAGGTDEVASSDGPEPARKRSTKRRERRRVPSWDEIMFGDKTERN